MYHLVTPPDGVVKFYSFLLARSPKFSVQMSELKRKREDEPDDEPEQELDAEVSSKVLVSHI